MARDDEESGGAPELVLSRCCGRRPLKRRKQRNEFTDQRKGKFLDEFAVTCNVKLAAEIAEVDVSTVYRHRRKDTAFRAAWIAAQEQGYAGLEAELVHRAFETLMEREVTEEAQARRSGMDAKLAFLLLQNFQRNRGKEPGDVIPRRSDLAEATRRLEKVMTAMKLIPEDELGGEQE